jgi:hypothetical protein
MVISYNKLYASRWAKIFQNNQTWKKIAKIFKKSEKIQVLTIYTSCVITDWFCGIYHHISSAAVDVFSVM